MVVEFLCCICGKQLSADRELAGQNLACPHCDSALRIPDPTESSAYATSGRWQLEELMAEEVPIRFSTDDRAPVEVDMTPMIDVTFLLLIFFMVTAAFSLQKSFEVPMQQDEQTTETRIQDVEDDSDTVVVRVDRYNTFHVSAAVWDEEKEAPSQQDLLFRLRQARSGLGSRPGAKRMILMAHGDAQHQKVVTAMDAGNAVGMEDVRLMSVEDESFFGR